MITKYFIILVMFTILFCLGSGLYYLISDQGKTKRTVKALTWRIALSVTLFLGLMIGVLLGVITPHPLS